MENRSHDQFSIIQCCGKSKRNNAQIGYSSAQNAGKVKENTLVFQVISSKGDLLEEAKPNTTERAWLRLAAGCAMLKICEQKGVGDESTLSRLTTAFAKSIEDLFIEY